MCRWTVYIGKPIIMADMVTRPQNSIVHQSRHSPFLPFVHGHHGEAKVMNTAINGDGFGIGWYDNFGPEPCVFKSTMPSWNCPNLPAIAAHVQSHCVFAHVRAASNGSIAEANCHPFKFGKMLFMQNGTIAHFTKIRVAILEEIKYTTVSMIVGMTDSEHAGALFVHFLPDHDPNKDHSGHVMKEAMLKMIKFILNTVKEEEKVSERDSDGVRIHTPSNMNFAVTDGTVMIATRYRDSKFSHPPSLYFSEVKQLHLHDSDSEHANAGEELDWHYPSDEAEVESVVVSSEPLTRQPRKWMLIPRNHLLVVTAHQRTIVEAIEFDEDEEGEKVHEAPSDALEVKTEIEDGKATEWDLIGKRERITGEEELREEVLKDPRNEMKVGKDRGSVEEQRKVKQELQEKAPDYPVTQGFDPARRRHSLASYVPQRSPYDHMRLTPLPPTDGTKEVPRVHQDDTSVPHRPPRRFSLAKAQRLEVYPRSACCDHHTNDAHSPAIQRSRRAASLPSRSLSTEGPDLYSSPGDAPTSMPSSPGSVRSETLSPLSMRPHDEDAGDTAHEKRHPEVVDDHYSQLDQKKATRIDKDSDDHKTEKGFTRAKHTSGRHADANGGLWHKAKTAISGQELHIRLDVSKGFLLLTVVNAVCALLWVVA